MIVLMDVDGVIADWLGSALEVVYEVTGKDFARTDVRGWLNFQTLGLSPEEEAAVLKEIEQPGFCASLEPLPGAKAGIKELRKLCSRLHFVTSPWHSAVNWTYEREQWLFDHGFASSIGEVTHTSAKEMLRGDILVDDHIANIQRWSACNPLGAGLLWSAPYNRNAECYRVAGWEDLLDFVNWRKNGNHTKYCTKNP